MKNKTFKIILIIVLSLLAIGITVFMINLINGKFKLNLKSFNSVSTKLEIDETYENNFTDINIDVEAGNILIKESNDEKVRVVIYNDEKDKSKVVENNNSLDIDVDSKKCNFICFNYVISSIEIYLPNSYSNKITIKNNLGDINIDSFVNSNIEIEENLGDIEIKEANNVKIKNDLGDVNIDKVNSAFIEVATGDIEVTSVNDIEAINNLGDIKIKNINNSLELENDCGDIKVDNVILTKNSTIESDLGDVKIKNIKDIYIDAETDLGKIKINKNYRISDITLKIKNDCGDIKVDN